MLGVTLPLTSRTCNYVCLMKLFLRLCELACRGHQRRFNFTMASPPPTKKVKKGKYGTLKYIDCLNVKEVQYVQFFLKILTFFFTNNQ